MWQCELESVYQVEILRGPYSKRNEEPGSTKDDNKCLEQLYSDVLWAKGQGSWWRLSALSRRVAGSIPRLCHWNFSLTQSFLPHYGPWVDSASNRNEYQKYFLAGKGDRCVWLTTLPPSCAECQPPAALRACVGIVLPLPLLLQLFQLHAGVKFRHPDISDSQTKSSVRVFQCASFSQRYWWNTTQYRLVCRPTYWNHSVALYDPRSFLCRMPL